MTGRGSSKYPHSRRWWIPVGVFVLVSLACAVPTVQLRGTTTPAPAASPQPSLPAVEPTGAAVIKAAVTQPAVSQAAAPLVLAEVDPPPGSEIGEAASLLFYFNQAMDTASVQRSVEIKPAVEANLDWIDPSTLRLTPRQPLPAETEISIVFNTNVRSQGGRFLAEPVEVRYRTLPPLGLMERLPRPDSTEVHPAGAVVAAFNRAVVPLVGETTDLPPAFALEPAAQGRGEWLNTSTYIFYPSPALAGGRQYTVRINQQLLPGTNLDWTFTSANPKVVSLEPAGNSPAWLDREIVVRFNQPMDRETLRQNFNLLDPDGNSVPGTISWNEDSTQLTFKPARLLLRSARYTVAVLTGARDEGGTPLPAEFRAEFETSGELMLTATKPAPGENLRIADSGFGLVTLTFSTPLARQNLLDYLKFDPPVDGLRAAQGDWDSVVTLTGYFQPETPYRFTVSPGLQDRWGDTIEDPIVQVVRTSPAAPAFSIPMVQRGNRVLFATSQDKTILGQATNITRLQLTSSNLSLPDFVLLAGDAAQPYSPAQQISWTQSLALTPNRSEPVEIPVSESGSALTPGLYYYQVASPQINQQTQPAFLLVVSDIHLVIKRSATQLFVWAYDLSRQQPAASSAVTVYNRAGEEVWTLQTDEQGIAQGALPQAIDRLAPIFVVMGKPGEPDFALGTTLWSQGVHPSTYGVPFTYQGGKPTVYLYTDRPIYRPGQTVYFRAVARQEDNGRYPLPDAATFTFQVAGTGLSGDPAVIYNRALTISDYGTASDEIPLPADLPPGVYTLSVEETRQSISFQVAEYRKPEIDLQAAFDRADRAANEDIRAEVKASYYFGAPAGNLPVSWTLRADESSFGLPERFQTGPQDMDWVYPRGLYPERSGLVIASGQDVTRPDGTLAVAIPAVSYQDQLTAGKSYTFVLEVTGQDESGFPVSTRAAANVHPDLAYLGVRPSSWAGAAGQELGFDVQVVDWQRQPRGNLSLTAVFQKVSWDQEFVDPQTGIPRFQTIFDPVASTDFEVDERGRARLAFTPADPGTYLLDVRSGGAVTQVFVWVGGEGSTPWPQLPNQQIKLTSDSAAYTPGQTARVFIPNPFPQGAQALVTVERGEVMRSQILQITTPSQVIDLPLGEEDAPNIYVSVLLIGASQDGKPDFRQGYVELVVDPAERLLQVNLAVDPPTAGPGQEVTVKIEARDHQNRPVQGEFSLSLVDKAVLALADPNARPIQEAFYSRQPLAVQSSLSLAAYSWRIPMIIPGRGGGGGDAEVQPVREDFRDTAYWNARVETDDNGQAVVKTRVPDNLTTWVLQARGLTRDTRTGEASAELVISKPLIIRPVTPRFLIAGDHVLLAAVVQNNTAGALAVEASLQSEGVSLDAPANALQRVNLASGERRRVEWWSTVRAVDSANLLFSARAPGLEDAVRVADGKLPVVRYAAPQTFATGGMIAEKGQRIETVAVPRSFQPAGGDLRLELSPSLVSALMSGLQSLEAFPGQYAETVLSRLLPNVEIARAYRDLGIESPAVSAGLDDQVRQGIKQLAELQNEDGGWGWSSGSTSNAYITAYILFGLTRAGQAGYDLPAALAESARTYLLANTSAPAAELESWQLDRLVFQTYALQNNGESIDLAGWLAVREKLSPWARALLALMFESAADTQQAQSLLSELQVGAVRSATGTYWEGGQARRNFDTPVYNTAVVIYALARLDPASPLLTDAVRYLVSTRQMSGGWYSSYDTAWSLMALSEAMKGTGDLQAQYRYSAFLDERRLIEGQAAPGTSLAPVEAVVPLADFGPAQAGVIKVAREEGPGRLYYRAFLTVFRPVETLQPVDRGLRLERRYYLAGKDCRETSCGPVEKVKLGSPAPVLEVRLTLTVQHDLTNVVVEDRIPAGTEIINAQLKTTQQTDAQGSASLEYDPRNPLKQGWGWRYFSDASMMDDRIRWSAEELPAGTYQLTYRLLAVQAGEFRTIPARAYAYYFPEIEGSSAGGIFTILP